MTKSWIPKAALLFCLSVATAVTTLSLSRVLIGAPNPPPDGVAQAIAQGGMAGSRIDLADLPPRKPLEEWDPSVTLKATLKSLTAGREGDAIHVSMAAEILCRQPGMRFTWAVYVATEDGDIIYNELFKDRIVTIPEGKITAYPSFEETLPLLPGRYRIMGSLFAVPADFDLASAADPPSIASCLSSQRFITIGLE